MSQTSINIVVSLSPNRTLPVHHSTLASDKFLAAATTRIRL